MRRPPVVAAALLTRFGAEDALVGDLYQEWSGGRSSVWFWYQAIAAVACGTIRDVARRPRRTSAALLAGWAAAAIVFLAGDTIADGIARLIWGWRRQDAYITDAWGPFVAGALVVSYGGFCASACLVARVFRRYPAMLLAYVASTFALLLAAGTVMEVLVRRGEPIPLVHPMFYPISVTLPYQWHSGIVLVPTAMLLCGARALRGHSRGPLTSDQ